MTENLAFPVFNFARLELSSCISFVELEKSDNYHKVCAFLHNLPAET